MSEELLSGVDTLVQLLLVRAELDRAAGLNTGTMVSGYPGSPLGTLDLALERSSRSLDAAGVIHRPGLNEELAAATVWGSQMGASIPYATVDGVAGLWYGKTPGLDRSGDVMKHGNAQGAGPSGGVVMACGDDPGAKSSTLNCDSQYTFEDAAIPVLVPADQQDLLDLGVHAFAMSRYSGAWVGLKIVTSVADGLGTVDLDPARHAPSSPSGAWQHHPQATLGPHAVPGQELLVVRDRLAAAQAYARHNGLDRVVGEPAELGIIASGTAYVHLTAALAALGDPPVRILRLAMTYPIDADTINKFAAGVGEILVLEEKRPFIETQVRSILHEAGDLTRVLGKRDATGADLVPLAGELDQDLVTGILAQVRPALRPPTRRALPMLTLPGRAPGFCSGCPHNRSTVAPAGALVGGGVGCHGITYFEARTQTVKKLPPTPMGAEGVPWLGLAPFTDEPHLIQNLGDGTLSHSGSLAIRASVAAGVNVTFKILYNRAVAMTGGQDVTGVMDVPALTRALEADGVARVIVCAEEPHRYAADAQWAPGAVVRHRDELPATQEELRATPGVTAIIYDQRCAAESRRLRKRGLLPEPPQRVVINEAVCEGCGDCGVKSNCLSVLPVETEFGDKRLIHDLSCNRDYTCVDGDCPSFVTLTPSPKGWRTAAAKRTNPALPQGVLPEPTAREVDGRFGIYFTGIGGTGIVTANRVLASAARTAGFAVTGLDQTGLSQKAGAVVSHLQLAARREDLGAATVATGGAHLYLSGDLFQAAGARHLEKVSPETVAVLDSDLTPTAGMLQTGTPNPELSTLREAIGSVAGRVVLVEAKRIAESLLANALLGNIVLLGAAYQAGGTPFALADVDAGLRDESNRTAFSWGRWAVHAPDAVAAALATAEEVADPWSPTQQAVSRAARLAVPAGLGSLEELVRRRAAQAVDYQDDAVARRYLALVGLAVPRGPEVTEAVAEAWFKLLTYKDEYEVARLHLRADYDAMAAKLGITGAYDLKFHLHPPTLRRLGLKKKLPLGRPYALGFEALARMKKLRGTRLDFFGRDPDRVLERAVADEYEALMRTTLASTQRAEQVARLALSPLDIKGYGPVKDKAVARWREAVRALQSETVPA